MTARHELVPFTGIDDVRFGMTRDEVARVAGAPDRVDHEPILGETTEVRGASEFVFADDTGTLSAITVYRPGRGKGIRERIGRSPYVPLFHGGIEILDKAGFAQLCAREHTKEGLGNVGVLFPELGFLVAGFRKRVPDGHYVIAFPREELEFYEVDWLDV